MTHPSSTSQDELAGWFAGRLPGDWFISAPTVEADREEILVVGALSEPDLPAGSSAEAKAAALEARVSGFREDTRPQRMKIADEAERRFGRKVSWGVSAAERRVLFTTQAIPAMTRLRMPERAVLDTLVDSGVARSRSHALAWCVRLVAKNQEEWLGNLREALTDVQKVREEGPA